MATIQPVTTAPDDEVVSLTWTAMANGDIGGAGQSPRYADKSVQVVGPVTNLPIEGSNDGTNWAALHDNLGAALIFTAAGIKVVLENTIHIRPGALTSGGAVTVIIVGKGT